MQDETWTNERIASLKQMWAGGSTAAAIAARLGNISRSAVLGKISRLRLDSPSETPPAARGESPARRRRTPVRKKSNEAPPATAPLRGKTLLELTNNSCRWPFGRPGTSKFHFCGAPGADLERGMPYCAVHAQRAYRVHEIKTEALTGRQSRKSSAPAADAPARAPAGRPFAINSGLRRLRF
jgi:GcrA cell cycle regulator